MHTFITIFVPSLFLLLGFFFDYESSCLNQRAPWNAMAPISFYSEGAMGKSLEPLVARGAGVRTRVSLVQVLVSLEQHPSVMLGFQQIFHALLGHPPPELSPVFLVSSSQLRVPSLDSAQRAIQSMEFSRPEYWGG